MRCFAYHQTKYIKYEGLTKELYNKWIEYTSRHKFKSSDVTLDKFPDLEQCFQTNINVYELSKDKIVTILYKSRECFSSQTMKLNLFEDHLSYISNFKAHAKKFQCQFCFKIFKQKLELVRHEKTCDTATKLRFPRGYFEPPKLVFDKLEDICIKVDISLQNFPLFATFDLEAALKHVNGNNDKCLQKITEHHPISVSICSNVDEYTNPKFILDPNLDSLLTKMISYLNEISDKTYS
jgi:hypothetical protein